MVEFFGQRLNFASVFLSLFLIDLAWTQPLPKQCSCDFKHSTCDLTTFCEHGVWTTARKFDSMTETIKYGFCDCEAGWSGNLCEYTSEEYETPEKACYKNDGVWNGDFCRCSKGTFGRYCQFRLISMEEKQKCVCGQQPSYRNDDEYLCQNDMTSQHPDFMQKIRVLANAQPVLIHPQETEDQITSSGLATDQPTVGHDELTITPLLTERGEERNIIPHYELATTSPVNAWIPICITLILIIIMLCILFIVKVRLYNKRSTPRPIISHPIGLTPAQLTTAISAITATQAKESPPPSYDSLEMK